MSLKKCFLINCREDNVAVCERALEYMMRLKASKRQTSSVVAAINGPTDSRKSLFWDEAVKKILGASAIFIASKSQSTEKDGRRYEFWIGTNSKTGEKCSLFVCNVAAVTDGNDHFGFFDGSVDLSTLGDFVILNNTQYYAANFKTDYDLSIQIIQQITNCAVGSQTHIHASPSI